MRSCATARMSATNPRPNGRRYSGRELLAYLRSVVRDSAFGREPYTKIQIAHPIAFGTHDH